MTVDLLQALDFAFGLFLRRDDGCDRDGQRHVSAAWIMSDDRMHSELGVHGPIMTRTLANFRFAREPLVGDAHSSVASRPPLPMC